MRFRKTKVPYYLNEPVSFKIKRKTLEALKPRPKPQVPYYLNEPKGPKIRKMTLKVLSTTAVSVIVMSPTMIAFADHYSPIGDRIPQESSPTEQPKEVQPEPEQSQVPEGPKISQVEENTQEGQGEPVQPEEPKPPNNDEQPPNLEEKETKPISESKSVSKQSRSDEERDVAVPSEPSASQNSKTKNDSVSTAQSKENATHSNEEGETEKQKKVFSDQTNNKSDETEIEVGGKLPKTSTPYPIHMIGGFFGLLTSSIGLLWRKRKG